MKVASIFEYDYCYIYSYSSLKTKKTVEIDTKSTPRPKRQVSTQQIKHSIIKGNVGKRYEDSKKDIQYSGGSLGYPLIYFGKLYLLLDCLNKHLRILLMFAHTQIAT
jgi:hypothetical protein